MSLQFVFGNSGSGKSDYLYQSILEEAEREPEKNFLLLVPEQFTMQTQRELVWRQPNHAIMNVDVLSFVRLAYRVFDDLGMQDLVILEETGKNLVLRKVAELKKKELSVLGGNLNKMGYIGEIKSLISEMAQYNITPEDLGAFLGAQDVGDTLRCKMQDILTMYEGFREYIDGKYITAEEILTLLCEVAEESELIRDSVIVFDEFTGFTPIQNRLLRVMLPLADRVILKMLEAEETTKGGIILTASAKEKPSIAEVISVGPGGMVDGHDDVMTVKPGDKVITSKYSGTEVKMDGVEYTIVRQGDILAIVE